jgi:NAD(P)-dependent dehydrogenase (short-subunit alcohol dehydrogenase family)
MHAAIVTGVSRGLGEALATELLARGAMVVGVGRSVSARHRSGRYRHVACDLAHPALVAAAVCRRCAILLDKPSAVTLINNAAVADAGRASSDGSMPLKSNPRLRPTSQRPPSWSISSAAHSWRVARAPDHQHLSAPR